MWDSGSSGRWLPELLFRRHLSRRGKTKPFKTTRLVPIDTVSTMRLPHSQPTRRQAYQSLVAAGASCFLGGARAQEIKRTPEPSKKNPPADAANATWLTLPPTPTLPSSARSGLVSINDTKIFFAQFGEGPPVLLLHGGLANSNYWGYQIGDLAKRFAVTVMDTRGHGRSPVMSRTFSYGVFAEDVEGLLDFLKIPAVAIVGWSDGAITGLQLAMSNPSRVSKLFAFGANSSLDGLKTNGSKNRTFAMFVNRCKTEYDSLSPLPEKWPQLLDGLRPMWRTEPAFTKQMLATIKTPTAISDGEYDEIIKREQTERMSREIPGARLSIQPEVSHFAMLQNAAQFNAVMMKFLTAKG
jgi:pimeloyl-ACP methyl ester carboxylesterase